MHSCEESVASQTSFLKNISTLSLQALDLTNGSKSFKRTLNKSKVYRYVSNRYCILIVFELNRVCVFRIIPVDIQLHVNHNFPILRPKNIKVIFQKCLITWEAVLATVFK